MKQVSKQAGMSAIGVLVVAAVVAFLGICVVKVGPLYKDYWEVKSLVESLAELPETKGMDKTEIKDAIRKRASTNGMYDFDPTWIVVTKQSGVISVEIDYEIRKELIYNADVVVTFYHLVEIDT